MPIEPPPTTIASALLLDQFEPTTQPIADWGAAQNWSAGQVPSANLIGLIDGVSAWIDPGTTLNATIIMQAGTTQAGTQAAGLIGNGGAIAFGAASQLSLVGATDLFAQDSLINQGVIALAPAASTDIVVDLGAISGQPGAAPPHIDNSGTMRVGNSATLTIAGTQLENSGTIALDGGTFIVTDGATTPINPMGADGTISLASTAYAAFSDPVAAQIFDFAPGANATLSLGDTTFGAILTLPGFSTADLLLLPNLANATINQVGSLATIVPIGTFHAQNPPCYLEGTEILTTRGHVAVEALAVGDAVITRTGAVRPIRWIGHRLVTDRGKPLPPALAPVHICADAFGPGLPRRALALSPDHGIYFEGVLIPAKHIINGATITAATPPNRVRYFHLELDSHDIVLAEGLACETYLDTGNRSAFENGAPHFGRRKSWDYDAAAPLCTQGKTLRKLRASLLARAQALGFARQFVTDLTLIIDGAAAKPLPSTTLTRRFALPAHHSDRAEIRSARFAPAAFDPGSDDWRQLGIALTGLRIGRTRYTPDTLARSGFHPRDAGDPALWTDGAGVIAVPPRAQRLTLEIAGLPLAWRSHAPPP